jgi:phage I-like protein
MPTKEELLAALKAEHGIDVEALQAQASQRVDTAALSAAVTEALKGSTVSLSAGQEGQVGLSDVTGAIVELSQQNRALADSVLRLTRRDAERTVDAFIDAGRLLPKTKDVAVEMLLSGHPEQLDAITAPADAPYVLLNHQSGGYTPDGEGKHDQNVDEELVRLSADYPDLFKQAK